MATKLEKRYGGRALRNGVMMVGPKAVGVAVRRPNGEIETAVEPFSMPGAWSKDIPFVRGVVSTVGMLKLTKVATKLERRLNPESKNRALLVQLAPGVGAAVADRLTKEMARRAGGRMVAPIEALGGVALPFVAFAITGKMPEVRDLWRYHGAEHKAVHTAEAGLELIPENATSMSRVHPRCGTVFAFWGIVGGIMTRNAIERMPEGGKKRVLGALAGPLVIGAAYEMVRLGNELRDHPVGRRIFFPAWQAQRFTTAEPEREELEVALAALQAVIDYEGVEA